MKPKTFTLAYQNLRFTYISRYYLFRLTMRLPITKHDFGYSFSNFHLWKL